MFVSSIGALFSNDFSQFVVRECSFVYLPLIFVNAMNVSPLLGDIIFTNEHTHTHVMWVGDTLSFLAHSKYV